MPSNKSDGGYLLPDPIDGDRICITVRLPNIPEHRQAFLGSIDELAHWYNWERDDAHTAKDVADIWREIYYQVAFQLDFLQNDCGIEIMDVRQNTDNPCILEKTADGGITWTPFADLSLCAPNLIYDPQTGQVMYDPPTGDPIPFPQSDPAPFDETMSHGNFGRPREEATEDERICAAAANLAITLRRTYESVQERLLTEVYDQWDLAEEVAVYISKWLPPAIRNAIGLAVFGGIIAAAAEFAAHDFTDEAETELKCIVIDCMNASTAIVTVDYGCLMNALDPYGFGNFPELNLMKIILPTIGGDGLNIAAGMNVIEDADCSDCATCVYGDYMEAGLGPHTSLEGLATVVSGYGAWVGSNGHGTGGAIQDEFDGGSQDRINVVINLGEECTITSISAWVKVDANAGAFCYIECNSYHADKSFAGGTSFHHIASGVGTAPYAKWDFAIPTDPTAQYIVFTMFDLTGSTYYLDDIEINIA